MLYEQKQLSMDRVAAYIKRALMLVMYLPPHSAIALMHIIHNLLKVSHLRIVSISELYYYYYFLWHIIPHIGIGIGIGRRNIPKPNNC
jgi:hypothetical protein